MGGNGTTGKGNCGLSLLDRTRNAGEHRIGARADELYGAYDECKDNGGQDGVRRNVLIIFI